MFQSCLYMIKYSIQQVKEFTVVDPQSLEDIRIPAMLRILNIQVIEADTLFKQNHNSLHNITMDSTGRVMHLNLQFIYSIYDRIQFSFLLLLKQGFYSHNIFCLQFFLLLPLQVPSHFPSNLHLPTFCLSTELADWNNNKLK